MICYKIVEKLELTEPESFQGLPYQFVVIATSAEWLARCSEFNMGIEMDINTSGIDSTRIEVNYDSMTGSFYIPDRNELMEESAKFAFALDEKGIVFIDDGNGAKELVERIKNSKKLYNPCLEVFLYSFIELIIRPDARILERFDHSLDEIEDKILDQETEGALEKVGDIRNMLRDFKVHYSQLTDLCQELEENENQYFKEENERYFHLAGQRVQTLYDMVCSLMDYTVQVRDYYQSQVDVKQNKNIAFLTVVSTIFMPLTLIAGWYGMNFKYMPELDYKWSYPIVCLVCLAIVIVCIIVFKKKKWI